MYGLMDALDNASSAAHRDTAILNVLQQFLWNIHCL
jgi:hypothetical protein